MSCLQERGLALGRASRFLLLPFSSCFLGTLMTKRCSEIDYE